MIQLKKILCPTDFSEPSLEGWRYAVEVARTFKAELCLVHAAPVFMPVPLDATLGAPLPAPAVAQAKSAKAGKA